MMGKTHKAIGVATGTAMVIYAVKSGYPVYALGMLTAPMGAMWPDIDHHCSKLGKANDQVMSVMKKVAVGVIVGSVLAWVLMLTVLNQLANRFLSTKIMIATVVMCTMFLISQSQFMHEKFPFFSKHRGIMHTVTIPLLVTAVAVGRCGQFLTAIAIGFSLGYLSHLLADCCTHDGCPLAWPLTEKCIHFLDIRTNTIWEPVVGTVLGAGILWFGFSIAEHKQLLQFVYAFVTLVVGIGLAHFILNLVPSKFKWYTLLVPVMGLAVGYFFYKMYLLVIVSACLGFVITIVKNKGR